MKYEIVVCNICNCSNYEKKLYEINSGMLAYCHNCDLFYSNPRRRDIIDSILEGETSTQLMKEKELNLKGSLIEFNSFLNLIHRYKKGGKLLDVGCYNGLFLYLARIFKWECYGIEPHKGGSNYARNQLKLNVLNCTLDKTNFSDKYFDVVTAFAVLEHTPDPLEILKEVRRIIKDDGLLVLTTPIIPFYLFFIKKKWRHFIGGHYFFFTDKSIAKMLSKACFKIIQKKYLTKSVDLDVITARLSSQWQPYNIGKLGNMLRHLVMKMGISSIRLSINLFDTKIYLAKPW